MIIKYFFDKNNDKIFFYNLGPTLNIFRANINIFNNNIESIRSRATHAIIYTKKIQIDILKKNDMIDSWDIFINNTYKSYFHKYAICYQTFPKTENQENWEISKLKLFIMQYVIKLLKYDIHPQPGYDILFYTIFILHYVIILLLIIFIFYLLYKFYSNISIKKSYRR